MTASDLTFKENVLLPLEHQPEAAVQKNPWILSPLLDFFFCYGGLCWVIMAAYFVADAISPSVQLHEAGVRASLFFVFFLTNTHTMATLVRLYGEPGLAKSLPFCAKGIPILCAILIIAGLYTPGMPAYLVKLNLVWNAFHWAGQSYGMALIYCFKRNCKLNDLERKLMWWAINTAPILYLGKMLCVPDWFDSKNIFVSLDEPSVPMLPMAVLNSCEIFCTAIMVAFFAWLIYRTHKSQSLPFPAFMLISTSTLAWTASGNFGAMLWLFAQPLLHGSQYIALCASKRLKEYCQDNQLPLSEAPRLIFNRPGLTYFGLLVVLGGFVSYALPSFVHKLTDVDGLLVSSVFTTVLSFQHFFIDMKIWRLRDPKMRDLLLA
jgi:hypothetical protein